MTLVNSYLFKVNNRNIRKKCEICSKLTMASCDIIGVVLASLLLILNICPPFSSVSVIDFEYVFVCWDQ